MFVSSTRLSGGLVFSQQGVVVLDQKGEVGVPDSSWQRLLFQQWSRLALDPHVAR